MPGAAAECKTMASILNIFIDPRHGGRIPPTYVVQAFGIAVMKGKEGVAVVRLPTGDWSAPCAIAFHNPAGEVQSEQETVLLFMTERGVVSLIQNVEFRLDGTHRFEAGPGTRGDINVPPIDPLVDVYVWVRYGNGYTDPRLLKQGMTGWFLGEDRVRHRQWHGEVSWYDVLTNPISVDRSSIGNALYVNLRIAAGSAVPEKGKLNYAELAKARPANVPAPQAEIQAQQQAAAQQQALQAQQAALLQQQALQAQQAQLEQLQAQMMAQQQQLAMQHQQELAQLQQAQIQQRSQFQQNLNVFATQPELMVLQQGLQQQQMAQQYQQMTPQQLQLLQQQQHAQLLQQQQMAQLSQFQQGYGRQY